MATRIVIGGPGFVQTPSAGSPVAALLSWTWGMGVPAAGHLSTGTLPNNTTTIVFSKSSLVGGIDYYNYFSKIATPFFLYLTNPLGAVYIYQVSAHSQDASSNTRLTVAFVAGPATWQTGTYQVACGGLSDNMASGEQEQFREFIGMQVLAGNTSMALTLSDGTTVYIALLNTPV